MAKRDYYEVLGIAREADADAIKKAYRKIAFESHPDRNPGDHDAEQRFKEASEAYEVLRDPEKRARYDRFGHAPEGGGPAGGFDFSGFDLADALRTFMSGGGFGDLFGDGGGGGPRVLRGNDLQVRLKLSLEEVATGVEKRIRVRHLRPCTTCNGAGGSGRSTCPQCQGRGRVRRVQQTVFGQFVNVGDCGRCEGSGWIVKEPCKTCGGDGVTSVTETISVNVPAGVAGGNFIPLRGMGDAGPKGGPAGDLIVLIEEKEHAVFERLGDDLRVDLPISFTRAALGGKVEVPTLTDTIRVDVPAGSQSGRVLRARGQGLPGLRGGRGDLLVRVVVWVPDRLSASDRKLVQALEDSETFRPPKPGKGFFERVKHAFGG